MQLNSSTSLLMCDTAFSTELSIQFPWIFAKTVHVIGLLAPGRISLGSKLNGLVLFPQWRPQRSLQILMLRREILQGGPQNFFRRPMCGGLSLNCWNVTHVVVGLLRSIVQFNLQKKVGLQIIHRADCIQRSGFGLAAGSASFYRMKFPGCRVWMPTN